MKKKLTKAEIKQYKGLIRGGKWNYVLTYGSRYAIITFLGFWFFVKFIQEQEFYVGLNMIIWGIAGLILGLWGWHNINQAVKENGKK